MNKRKLTFQLCTGILLVLLFCFLSKISESLSYIISPMVINIIFRIICIIIPILVVENFGEIGISRNGLTFSLILGTCFGILFLLSHIFIKGGIYIKYEDINLNTFLYLFLVMFIE